MYPPEVTAQHDEKPITRCDILSWSGDTPPGCRAGRTSQPITSDTNTDAGL
ncbi:hypothetical protein SNOG_11732 [Parastagonospora nodorum SN15]|uniref:Uncharacterized protein n=1 Tax=Phaeosphaeria nodorum (strain SN15 / ATCC MYA-4574 / FGSC 10173) TaxID=321614 RepID=Q0U932_PHANO|nr:hypothetical protein SNOG_11732 [Parastagonospora nodorum SN15]EAT80776.1 hypothetical protein SNOG_11732 [Parastagonospora nodorum SN15]